MVVKDKESRNIGVIDNALPASRVSKTGGLGASRLILADKIEFGPAQIGPGRFVIGPYKVRPRSSREFSNAESAGLSRGPVYSSAIRF